MKFIYSQNSYEIYNPESVVMCMEDKRYMGYLAYDLDEKEKTHTAQIEENPNNSGNSIVSKENISNNNEIKTENTICTERKHLYQIPLSTS